MKKLKNYFLFSVFCFLLSVSVVFASVDTDVANSTAVVVGTLKDNTVGVISSYIMDIVILGLIILVATFIYTFVGMFLADRKFKRGDWSDYTSRKF